MKDDNKLIKEELFKILISNEFITNFGFLIVVFAISSSLLNISDNKIILIWTSILIFTTIFRYFIVYLYNKNKNNNYNLYAKIIYTIISIEVTIYSIGLALLFPYDNIEYQTLIIILNMGLASGAIISLSPNYQLSRFFVIMLTIPIVLITYFLEYYTSNIISFLSIIYLFVFIVYAKRLNENLTNLIKAKNNFANAKKEVYKKAYFDGLTNLPNRASFYTNLENIISTKNNKNSILFFIDIDNFKMINDTYGHKIGDYALQEFTKKVKKLIPNNYIFARLSGDEFVILFQDFSNSTFASENIAKKLSNQLFKEFEETLNISTYNIHLTFSIGITIIDNKSNKSSSEILNEADIAMYESKKSGKNKSLFFKDYMSLKIKDEIQLNKDLKNAIIHNEFEIYYHAITNINTNNIESCEALIRWNHPQKGLISPDDFISFAEKNNYIIDIGKIILNHVCIQYNKWNKLNNTTLNNISINVSAKEFMHNDFISNMIDTLKKYNVNPEHIKLELTESIIIENIDIIIVKMNILKDIGIKFSMDDFGTGYSSLSNLKDLPFDYIKLDKSFVYNILHNRSSKALIKTILNLSSEFGFLTIAEGVETIEQYKLLKSLKCDYYQGHLQNIPMKNDEFEKLIFNKKN